MRSLALLIGVFLLGGAMAAAPAPAKAWGKYGHLTVCDLAYRNLTPTSRHELNALLQSRSGGTLVRGRGRMPDRRYTSFNVGCLEEDALPRRHPEDHFINVGRETTAISSAACPGGAECILSGIERDLATLRDRTRSRDDRVFALMAIGHWIGDIHQPLHVSFADDRGGNGVVARLSSGRCGTSSYRVENLHAVWDNCLLEAGLFERVRKRADFKTTWSANTITYRAVDTLLANTSLTDERALVAGAPAEWANESYQITLAPGVRYCTLADGICRYSPAAPRLEPNATKRRQQISQTYLRTHERAAEDRVRRAGFRLAHLLNQALDPAYTEPVRNGLQGP